MQVLHGNLLIRYVLSATYSSGKMGIALADAAADFGAEVELVLGPVNVIPARSSVKVINVVTAESMASECINKISIIAILQFYLLQLPILHLRRSKTKR